MLKTLISPNHLTEIINVYDPIYKNLNVTQKEIVWDQSPYKIIQGVRRSGKTRIVVSLALLHAICAGPKNIIITVHSGLTIRFLVRELEDLLNKISNKLTMDLNYHSNKIKFSNGSTIEILSIQTENNSYGYRSYDLLLMDEAALYGKFTGNLARWWNKLRDSAEIVITSTRVSRSKKNFFWSMWLDAVNKKNRFIPYAIRSKDIPRNKGDISNLKKMMTRSRYDTECTIRWK
jgi:hypothetical protein